MSTLRSMMSSPKLLTLDQSERILYTVKAGRLSASRRLLFLLIRLLKQYLLFSTGIEEAILEDIITGIEERIPIEAEEFDELLMDPFPSNWIMREDSEVSPRSRTISLSSSLS